MNSRPAIVPIIDRDEYLRLVVSPGEGTNDLVILHDAEDEMCQASVRQVSIPIRHTRSSQDYGSMSDRDCVGKISDAFNVIRKLIRENQYRRVIFLADPPTWKGEFPLFARGILGRDVQLFISEMLYHLGVFVSCKY